MRRVAYCGPETGSPDEAVYVLEAGTARFVFRGPVPASTPLGERVAAHGDGVIDLALGVSSAGDAYEYAVAHGARGLEAPRIIEDEHGKVVLATIATYGDTRHTLVERSGYSGVYLPGYVPTPPIGVPYGRSFSAEIDHCVGNVELGRIDETVGVLPPGDGLHQHEGVRRRRHRHPVFRLDEQGGRRRERQGQVPAKQVSSWRSASRRSTNTWSSTAVPACSTSRWPPTTSWPASGR